MKHFTSVADVLDINQLVQSAQELARSPHSFESLGKGKALGCIFLNPSLRTRMSTQRAAQLLGLSTLVMNINSEGWKLEFEDGAIMNSDKAEHIKDAAAVMGQYCDILGIRAFAELKDRERDYQEPILNAFLSYAGVPIVNLESATVHPCQSLADLITIETYKNKARPKVVLSWAPHPKSLPQAVANSFAEWMNKADVELVITHPKGYELAPQFTQGAPIEYDQEKALEGADFVYTKNWSSYTTYGEVLPGNEEWTLTGEKMRLTHQAKFMHCLPVRRNVIVADEVIDSPDSLVQVQARNRVLAAQVVLKELIMNR